MARRRLGSDPARTSDTRTVETSLGKEKTSNVEDTAGSGANRSRSGPYYSTGESTKARRAGAVRRAGAAGRVSVGKHEALE
eukprot:2390623-Amphidinium_carterae.1